MMASIMTTFQSLVQALLQVFTLTTPLSGLIPASVEEKLLEWGQPSVDLKLLVLFTGSVCFVTLYRFDLLGLTSALIKSLFSPLSLKQNQRSLDQHNLIFILGALIPIFTAKLFLSPVVLETEALQHPFVHFVLFILLALAYRFAYRWNKRILGLNHLKLSHLLTLTPILLFCAHPAFPLMGLLWIAFALQNYHFEAIIKYSVLLLGITLCVETGSLLGSLTLLDAVRGVGYLNALAILVVSFTAFWMVFEHFKKNFNESLYQTASLIAVCSGLYTLSIFWLKG